MIWTIRSVKWSETNKWINTRKPNHRTSVLMNHHSALTSSLEHFPTPSNLRLTPSQLRSHHQRLSMNRFHTVAFGWIERFSFENISRCRTACGSDVASGKQGPKLIRTSDPCSLDQSINQSINRMHSSMTLKLAFLYSLHFILKDRDLQPFPVTRVFELSAVADVDTWVVQKNRPSMNRDRYVIRSLLSDNPEVSPRIPSSRFDTRERSTKHCRTTVVGMAEQE